MRGRNNLRSEQFEHFNMDHTRPSSSITVYRRIAALVVILLGSVVTIVDVAYAAGGGVNIAHASWASIGATEFGDTASPGMAPSNNSPIDANCPAGSSNPSTEQVWEVGLVGGDQVTITGGYSPPATSMEIAFWPAGTTDASVSSGNVVAPNFPGSNIGGYPGGSLGPQQQPIVFTVPSSGTYPFVVGNCDGSTGPYQFNLAVQKPGLSLTEITGQLVTSAGKTTAVLVVYIRTRNNYFVNNNIVLSFVMRCPKEPSVNCGQVTSARVTNNMARVYFSVTSYKGSVPGVVLGQVVAENSEYGGGGLYARYPGLPPRRP
jgi:hypothetical protein